VRPTLLLLAVALAGCRPPPSAARPNPIAAPQPAPPRDPWLERIEAEVSQLRELRFRKPVPFERQTRDAFRGFVHAEIARELPPAKSAAMSRGLHLLGFLPRPLELARVLEDLETVQVAAYYDPRTGVFRVLEGSSDQGDELATVVAHELDHAVVHQSYDLVAYQGGEGNSAGLSDDERTARTFVVEGEATFLMMAHALAHGAGAQVRLGPLKTAALRMSLQMLGAADFSEIAAMIRHGGAPGLGAEGRAQLDQLADLPPILVMSLVEPYMKGALFVSEVWGQGGWAAVNRLYGAPPASTEQVLHPEDKFLAHRDPPVLVRFAAGQEPFAGRKPVTTDVFGELGLRAYFKTWKDADPAAAAAGWGGDRYWLWDRPGEDGMVALMATRWDSDADAVRFRAAYLGTLRARFAKTAIVEKRGEVRVQRPDGTVLVLSARGRDVDVIDGARSVEVPGLLQALAAAERTPGGH
jgi:hypothetical protein